MTPRSVTLHAIGHAHLDPAWLWRWPEGFEAARATFRSALDRMKEYPGFVFTASSAAVYEWIEGCDAAMFDEIRERVDEGRWYPAGGWWMEPDLNLPCGESLVRQALYGQRYFRGKLGVTCRVGLNPDSFGHNAMLPQILAKSGCDAYVFMRPDDREMDLPGRVFRWTAPDGSSVLAYRIAFAYGTWGDQLRGHVLRSAAEVKAPLAEGMVFYGVGNHGGGPTRENLDSLQALADDPEAPRILFSHPDRFFETIRREGPELPEVTGEMQIHAKGCYSAHSGIKDGNRRAENALLDAEALCSVAANVLGRPYPDLSRAWKNTLFNQFHDILCGTCIREAYDDARDLHGEATAIADRAVNDAVQSLAAAIDTTHEDAGALPIVVFNQHAHGTVVPVEVEVPGDFVYASLEDAEGRSVPFQHVRPSATVQSGRSRIVFVAEIPGLGWRAFFLRGGKTPPKPWPDAGHTRLDNGVLRVELDADTGGLRVRDHRRDLDLLATPAAVGTVIDDPSDTWSHGILRFDRQIGTFQPTRVRLLENGPVRAAIRVQSAWGASRLTQDVTLYHDLDSVFVSATVDWRERRKMLKLRFPTALSEPRVTSGIPYGCVERPADGIEHVAQGWLDVSGKEGGLGILTPTKGSYDALGADAGLTVLRSPIYAHHDPYEPKEGEDYDYTDQGIQRFRYALVPHVGDPHEAGIVGRASAFARPPVALATSQHPGVLPGSASHASLEPANVSVTTVKRAEDGDGFIVRARETSGKPVDRGRLTVLGRDINAPFGPFEIKTFRLTDAGVAETDLLEDAL